MRRFLVFFCIVSTAAVGAWALPAGRADSTVDSAAADDRPSSAPARADAPTVSAASVEREIAETPLEVDDDPVSPALVGQEPDHLTGETPPPAAEAPAQIVTTTTAPPTTAPVVTVAFTAAQAYGSCDESVPYDIFSGAATPGSTITISSPYGSGSATADGNGHWERTVEFPSAPRGETFSVSVSGLGGSKTFSFTATGGGSHT